jgi:hypothetical protein
MAGILNSTEYDLNNRVQLTAPINDRFTFVGNAGSTVDITGVADCTVTTAFNTGTDAGGHAMCVWAEDNGATSSGDLAYGNNATNAQGPRPTKPGIVRALTISSSSSATCTMTLLINGAATGASVSLSASQNNTATVNQAFTAGQRLEMNIGSGTADNPRGAMWLVFD